MEDALHHAPEQPDVAGACLAAIVAPALATALAALVLGIATGPYAPLIAFVAFLYALFIAAPYVLLFGLPAYLLVRRFTVQDWWLCGACGLILGAVPYLLISATGGGRLGDHLSAASFLAVMGLIGGLAFRWKLYAEAGD